MTTCALSGASRPSVIEAATGGVVRARTMVSVAVPACVALVACACAPEKAKEDTGPKPSQPSASTRAEEPSATRSASARTEKPSATPTGDQHR